MNLILPKLDNRRTADLWVRRTSHSNFLCREKARWLRKLATLETLRKVTNKTQKPPELKWPVLRIPQGIRKARNRLMSFEISCLIL